MVGNNSSTVKNIASKIADRYFNNNFIGAPQKFGNVIRDFLQSIDIIDIYKRANAINTDFLWVIFILDKGSKLLDTRFFRKPFSQYIDLFYSAKAIK